MARNRGPEGEQEREEAFPPHVADAINILRHTKIGRWERGYHYYFDRCDAKARQSQMAP